MTTSSNKEAIAFPPAQFVPDTIVWFKDIDWADVRARARGGINNVGLVIAVIGDKLHSFGCYLGEL